MENEKSNWVSRHFARERNLQNGPASIWQEVLTAIEDACNTFIAETATPVVKVNRNNGHAIVVSAEFPRRMFAGMPGGMVAINSVRVVFDEGERLITSALNGNTSLKFKIDGDEHGCFISYQGGKIDAEKLSEVALRDALFKEPPEPKQTFPPPRGEWS